MRCVAADQDLEVLPVAFEAVAKLPHVFDRLCMTRLAKDGVYIVTGKYADDKNAKVIPFIGKDIAVKGVVTEKDGKKMIDVTSIAEVKK